MSVSAQPTPLTAESRARSQTRWVLALALALRLPVLWIAMTRYAPTWFFTRGIEMGLLANTLLTGKGLSSPFGESMGPTGPTAFIAPGYPILIAGIFRVFGSFSPTSECVVLCLHIALNLATIWLAMDLARTLLDRRAALLAGLFWACSPPLLWLPTIFWETSISICMLTGLVWLAVRCRPNPSRRTWLLLGVGAGVLILFNSALLPLVAAILCWLAWQTRAAGWVGPTLCALALVVVFSPWPIRNARVFHKFIPLRTTVGFELWMGNRDGATGYLEESLFPMYDPAELRSYIDRGEIAYSQHKSDIALEYIESYPTTFVRLSLVRAFRFWTGTGTKGGSSLFAVQACITTLLGWLGLWLLSRSSIALAVLFALPLLIFPLPYYITHAEFRYRLVIDPILTVLSGYAVSVLWRKNAEATPELAAQVANG